MSKVTQDLHMVHQSQHKSFSELQLRIRNDIKKKKSCGFIFWDVCCHHNLSSSSSLSLTQAHTQMPHSRHKPLCFPSYPLIGHIVMMTVLPFWKPVVVFFCLSSKRKQRIMTWDPEGFNITTEVCTFRFRALTTRTQSHCISAFKKWIIQRKARTLNRSGWTFISDSSYDFTGFFFHPVLIHT